MMGRIVYEEVIAILCPVCGHTTAGIILEQGSSERVCLLCKRKLWKCSYCGQLTFGTLKDEAQCGYCQKTKYHAAVRSLDNFVFV